MQVNRERNKLRKNENNRYDKNELEYWLQMKINDVLPDSSRCRIYMIVWV